MLSTCSDPPHVGARDARRNVPTERIAGSQDRELDRAESTPFPRSTAVARHVEGHRRPLAANEADGKDAAVPEKRRRVREELRASPAARYSDRPPPPRSPTIMRRVKLLWCSKVEDVEDPSVPLVGEGKVEARSR